MSKQVIQPAGGPKPGGAYSPALRVGDFVFVAGQVGRNPTTGETGGDIEAQTRQVLENIKTLLDAGGASMNDVVKASVHLSDLANFQRFNAVYETYFDDPKPVRTTVGSQLPGGFLIEIDVIAHVSK